MAVLLAKIATMGRALREPHHGAPLDFILPKAVPPDAPRIDDEQPNVAGAAAYYPSDGILHQTAIIEQHPKVVDGGEFQAAPGWRVDEGNVGQRDLAFVVTRVTGSRRPYYGLIVFVRVGHGTAAPFPLRGIEEFQHGLEAFHAVRRRWESNPGLERMIETLGSDAIRVSKLGVTESGIGVGVGGVRVRFGRISRYERKPNLQLRARVPQVAIVAKLFLCLRRSVSVALKVIIGRGISVQRKKLVAHRVEPRQGRRSGALRGGRRRRCRGRGFRSRYAGSNGALRRDRKCR